jgi:hypothetical protein
MLMIGKMVSSTPFQCRYSKRVVILWFLHLEVLDTSGVAPNCSGELKYVDICAADIGEAEPG